MFSCLFSVNVIVVVVVVSVVVVSNAILRCAENKELQA